MLDAISAILSVVLVIFPVLPVGSLTVSSSQPASRYAAVQLCRRFAQVLIGAFEKARRVVDIGSTGGQQHSRLDRAAARLEVLRSILLAIAGNGGHSAGG